MNTNLRKAQCAFFGIVVTLICGVPALADDTEILLINPNAANPPQPNVMFIFDSSGSMRGRVTTQLPYDSSNTYPPDAGCDPDMLYWTEVSTVPDCNTTIQFFEKTAGVCDAAAARMTGLGSYSDNMVHYRSDGAGSSAWQTLEPGNANGLVECQSDSGVHGLGAASPADVFAQKGSTLTPYTADPNQEIDWTTASVTQGVTVYDGNFLNYSATPVFVNARKIDIVADVATLVLNSIEDLNVGIMRFTSRDGGAVIHDIVDLETNRTSLIDAIQDVPASGWTPLSETMYENALFWHGLPSYYPDIAPQYLTDPAALAATSPDVYEQPEMESCTKNFNVLMSDGQPTRDTDPPGLVDTLPNWFGTLGYTGCTGGGNGACLEDISQYLFTNDINPTLAGEQVVTTHTIAFDIDLPLMESAANQAGGEYFTANDVASFAVALLQIVSNVQDRTLSFTAPAVAVNSFNRTQNLNDLYLTTFGARGKVHWPGNLKKYEISGGQIVDSTGAAAVDPATGFFTTSAQSFWSGGPDGTNVTSGGAANQIPAPSTRNLYTYNGTDSDLTAPINELSTANSSAYSPSDFGLTGGPNEPTLDGIIDWARGEDGADLDGDGDTTEQRFQMGDPLHSRPAAVVYGGTAANPDTVVFTATNDGYVHAIEGATGAELWSFVPKEHLANFTKLFFNPDASYKNYGVDGDIVPVTQDVDGDGIIEAADGDFVIILFGMRRGGDNYYAIDVTDKTNPQLLWQYNTAGLGQSWSAPTVARVNMAAGSGQSADQAVVIFGGGYDIVHDTISHPLTPDGLGAGIYMLDLQTGNLLWRAGSDGAAQLTLAGMTRAMPTSIRAIDLNGDGFANRMYASDLGGQIWRFDIAQDKLPNGVGTDALVTGGVLAQLGAEGNGPVGVADTRRFYNAPDISIFNDTAQNRRFVAVNIGSGYRAHPLNNSNTDRFFSIRDKNVFNAMTQAEYDTFTPVTDADLIEISGTVGATIDASAAGWRFTLPPNQKVLTDSTTFNNEIFFVAFSPDPDNVASTSCAAGVGSNFLYRISVVNGDPIADLDNVTPGTEDALRVTNLAQGGIAPSPRFVFPSPDPSCTGSGCYPPPPLGCVGVECFDPGFVNNPVRTLWTQDGIE